MGDAIITPPAIKCTYGILDITKGRQALLKHIAKHGPVRVLIEATIDNAYGHDDGTSIEYNMTVRRLVIDERAGS